MTNITLSADAELVAKARAYAQAHNTTVNQLVRDYLARLTGQLDPERAANQYAELTRQGAGRSEDGFVFDRRATHARPGDARR